MKSSVRSETDNTQCRMMIIKRLALSLLAMGSRSSILNLIPKVPHITPSMQVHYGCVIYANSEPYPGFFHHIASLNYLASEYIGTGIFVGGRHWIIDVDKDARVCSRVRARKGNLVWRFCAPTARYRQLCTREVELSASL